jgi:hypothetical protein
MAYFNQTKLIKKRWEFLPTFFKKITKSNINTQDSALIQQHLEYQFELVE